MSGDTVISTSTARYLVNMWSYQTGGPIASQPAIVDGVAYVGSWDGYEYAIDVATGTVLWKTYLGVTNGDSDCDPQSAGVSSAATVTGGNVYVGGGDDYWYALDASTGAVEWRVYTGDSSAAGGMYNWSSRSSSATTPTSAWPASATARWSRANCSRSAWTRTRSWRRSTWCRTAPSAAASGPLPPIARR